MARSPFSSTSGYFIKSTINVYFKLFIHKTKTMQCLNCVDLSCTYVRRRKHKIRLFVHFELVEQERKPLKNIVA